MPTEREVVYLILNDRPEGISGLFDRHGALFREGLLRFFDSAGPEQADRLEILARTVVDHLKAGRFDDLSETFYNWIVRVAWCTFMKLKIEGEGGDHLDPEIIYTFVEKADVDALDETVRKESRSHIESCALCRALLEQSKDIPVEIRHAGAIHPEDFNEVIHTVLKRIQE
jgi:hypothetical protein